MAQNFLSDIKLGDSIYIRLGSRGPASGGGDLNLSHNGTNSFIDNHTGQLYIRNFSDDKNIHLQSDDGSGGMTDYIVVHGSENIVKFQEHSRHLDNKEARFGTGSDLKIYHESSTGHSHIKEAGTGELRLSANIFRVLNANSSETMIYAEQDGKVQLRFNESTKFETTNAGATVTGALTVTGDLVVNGTQTILNTQTVEVEDNIIVLNKTQSDGSATASTSGIAINRGGSTAQASFIFDDSDDYWDLTHNLAVSGDLKVYGGTNGITVDTAGHASVNLDRASTSYDNNLIYRTNGTIKWRLWQDGSDDYLYIRDEANSSNMVSFQTGGNTTFAGDIELDENLTFTTNNFVDIANTGTGAMRFKPSGSTLALTLTGANATFAGTVTAGSLIKSGGTSSQYLMADGSVSTSSFSGGTVPNAINVTGTVTLDNFVSIQGVDTGNPQANTDELRVSGYGIMGRRGAVYVTNSDPNGAVQIGVGGSHNSNPKLIINSSDSTFYNTLNVGTFTSTGTTTLNLRAESENSTKLGFFEDSANYGFSLNYAGDVNDFIIKRHDNSANGADVITLFRESNQAKFAGNLGISGAAAESSKALRIKSQSVSAQSSAIEVMDNSNTNAIIRMGEKSTDGGRLHMFDGGTEKIAFYTDGTDNHISAGQVGIGLNNPSKLLHVYQTGNTQPLLVQTDDHVGIQVKGGNSHDKYVSFQQANGSVGSKVGWDHSSQVLKLNAVDTFASTHLAIDVNGKVGIGTDAPVSNLTVDGTTGVYVRNSSGGKLVFDDTNVADGSTPMVSIRGVDGNTIFSTANRNASTDLTTGSTERMRITSAGLVGIGSTTPSHRLQVYDAISDSPLKIESGDGFVGIKFKDPDADDNLFYRGDTESFYFTGNRLGVNTSNPTRNLSVYQGDSGASYGHFINTTTGSNAGDGVVVGISAAEEAIFWNHENTIMRFATNNAERLRIDTSGVTHIMGASASSNNSLQLAYNSTSGLAEIGPNSTGGSTSLEIGTSNSGTYAKALTIANDKTATFEGAVIAKGAVQVPYAAATKKPMIVLQNATSYGLFHTEAASDIFSFDFAGVSKQEFKQDGSVTFAGDTFTPGLYVNATSAVAGTQVAIVVDGNQNLQRWGSTSDGGSQHSYRFRIDQNYKFIGNSGGGDKITIHSNTGNIDTDGDVSASNLIASGYVKSQGPDGGLILRTWTGNSSYGSFSTANMSGDEYAVLTDGTHTFISGGTGGSVHIRAGNNISNHELEITSNLATFKGNLQVNGNLNIVGNSSVVNVEDLNVEQGEITLNYNASSDTSGNANGAGIRIQDAVNANTDATMLWNATDDRFVFSHMVQSPGLRSTSSNTFTGGMSSFETTLTNNDDWQNSPISILERGNVGSGQTADKYSPNLNFHWGGIVSRSLWMDASGHLHYGEYSTTGIPDDQSGHFRANEIHANIFRDKSSTGFYLDPASTGTSLNIAGAIELDDAKPIKWGTENILSHNGTQTYVGDSTTSSALTVTGGNLTVEKGTVNGVTQYTKSYASLDTTGQAVAGLVSSSNGASAMFIFETGGGNGSGGYQKVVYNCLNVSGTWSIHKDIDEGGNRFDVTGSGGSTVTFTFKARSSTQSYSPKVIVRAVGGSAINTTYI